jgi:hypothetical protein
MKVNRFSRIDINPDLGLYAAWLRLAKTSYTCKMNALAKKLNSDSSDIILAMIVSLRNLLGWILSSFRSPEVVLENLPLRRQLLALLAQRPRPRLTALHKLFWVALRTLEIPATASGTKRFPWAPRLSRRQKLPHGTPNAFQG